MKKEGCFAEIDIASGIAVMLVVLGLSQINGVSAFGSTAVSDIHDFCNGFHMALFFILAGFAAAKTVFADGIDLGKQIGKRALRLLVPYAVYSVLTVGLKLIFDSCADRAVDLSELWKVLIGKNPNGGLWYLLTLFVISALFLIVGRAGRICRHPAFLLGIGALMYIGYYFSPDCLVNNTLKYAVFYALGLWLRHDYEKMFRSLRSYKTIAVSALLLLTFAVFKDTTPLNYPISALLGSIAVIGISIRISEKENGFFYRLFNETGDYAYEIYLFSYFVQVAIRVVFYQMMGLPYLLVVAMMFVFGIGVPYFAAKYIVRRSRVLSALLTGKFN